MTKRKYWFVGLGVVISLLCLLFLYTRQPTTVKWTSIKYESVLTTRQHQTLKTTIKFKHRPSITVNTQQIDFQYAEHKHVMIGTTQYRYFNFLPIVAPKHSQQYVLYQNLNE